MAPKSKGLTLSLQQFNQKIDGGPTEPSLPTQSSGIVREHQDRSAGPWDRPARSEREGRRQKDDIGMDDTAADNDDAWRGSRVGSAPAQVKPSSSTRRPNEDNTRGSYRRPISEEEEFSRDSMQSPSNPSKLLASSSTTSAPRDSNVNEEVNWRGVSEQGTSNKYVSKSRTNPSTAPVSVPITVSTPPQKSPRDNVVPTSSIAGTVETDNSTDALPTKPGTGESQPSSRATGDKPATAESRARSMMMDTIPSNRPHVKEEVILLAPVKLRKPKLDETAKKKLPAVAATTAAVTTATTPAGASTQAHPVDDAKIQYKKTKEERSRKLREEEEQRRMEVEREKELQKRAIEQLMTGDPQKMKKLQENIEPRLKSGSSGETLLSQFQSALTDADLNSLIPSIVVAKCLVVQSIETLRPTWDSSSMATDKDRLELVSGLVRILQPTLNFLFQKSEIKKHKLKFLLEIQRLVHATGFPRVSPGLSLIEAIWDALYMEGVIEYDYFMWWYEDTNDTTVGRNDTFCHMFNWFCWIQGSLKGRTLDEEEDEEDEEDDV